MQSVLRHHLCSGGTWQKEQTHHHSTHDKPRQHIKKQRHHFAKKDPYSQSYGFSSSHVWMWELDYKESWAPKNWCFWTLVLKKTLESPLDCKEIKHVNPKGNQSWIFFGRTDAEAKVPVLWSPDEKSQLIGKDPDAGKDWRQEEKGTTEDKMVGWHHWLNGHEFEQILGDGEGQESLALLQSRGSQRIRHDWATEQHSTYGMQRSCMIVKKKGGYRGENIWADSWNLRPSLKRSEGVF